MYDTFYKLSDTMQQIQAYVEQVILGHVPGIWMRFSPASPASPLP
ncbi:MAG TPA: hypothetical protein VNZ23_19870 [Xanthobacteraceae bacterium]|nr:hypothetical protein [Xanthobacteraceae bacterium]